MVAPFLPERPMFFTLDRTYHHNGDRNRDTSHSVSTFFLCSFFFIFRLSRIAANWWTYFRQGKFRLLEISFFLSCQARFINLCVFLIFFFLWIPRPSYNILRINFRNVFWQLIHVSWLRNQRFVKKGPFSCCLIYVLCLMFWRDEHAIIQPFSRYSRRLNQISPLSKRKRALNLGSKN
jgi:hypothetical protein